MEDRPFARPWKRTARTYRSESSLVLTGFCPGVGHGCQNHLEQYQWLVSGSIPVAPTTQLIENLNTFRFGCWPRVRRSHKRFQRGSKLRRLGAEFTGRITDATCPRNGDASFSLSTRRSARFKPSHHHKIPCGQKIKTVGKAGVVPSWRGRAACRPQRFFGAINGALCGSAGKWGETYGMGTYPGLHHRDGGPGAAAAELV